jgi:ADP-ribose pyrophosphatase
MSIITLKREKHYQAHVFDVASVQVRLPNGRERSYDLIEHGDSVTILPIDADGNIYFVKQYRIGSNCDLLELPAGVMDPGEDPSLSARRELREEIGLDAQECKSLGGFYLAAGYSDEFNHVFLASGLFESPLDPDEDEFLNIQKIPVNNVYQKAFQGAFQDAKTLAALLIAKPYLD